MEMEGCQEFDLECEDHDLIDNDQFPETVDAKKVIDSLGIDEDAHLPELCETTEPEKTQSNRRYNLRKSLAWDSAFFTSAGVLDAEELSNMITGPDKKQKHALPGIQEELSGSTESISTLQSDSLTLENLEDDLFLDIRASIQRSRKKASNSTNSSIKISAVELADDSTISSPKKEDFVSQNKNPNSGVKKISSLQTVRMSKAQLKPTGKSSGRPIKTGHVQSQTGSVNKIGEINSVLPRPPKTISSSLLPSTASKRVSIETGRVKTECGSSKQGSISCKERQLPKVSALGGSKKVLPTPAVPLKRSSLVSSTGSVHSTRSSTSSDNSINSASSGNATKPTLMTAKRNLAKNNNISTGTSGSVPRDPSRAGSRNKLPVPNLSSYLKSTKISASVSPASSISEWSSASSTTSSVVNEVSNNLRTSSDTPFCRPLDGDEIHMALRHNPAGQKAERQGSQGVCFTSRTSKKSSTESGTFHAPAKLSGLRLPSPKIGFFDGSSSRTPNGHQRSQSSLHPGLPKNGTAASTPRRSSNGKMKSAKVPLAKTTSSLANINSSSPKAASPAYSEEKFHPLVNTPTVSMDVTLGVKGSETGEACQKVVEIQAENGDKGSKTGEPFTPGVKDSKSGEACQKVVEIQAENGDKQVVHEVADAVDKDNSGDLCLNKNMSSGDVESSAGEVNNTSGSEYISQGFSSTKSLKGKLKSAKVPTAMLATSFANIKPGSPMPVSLASSQEKSHSSVKASSVPMDINNLSILSLGVEGYETGEPSLKAMEVPAGNGDKQVVGAGTVDKNNFADLSLNKSNNPGHTETPAGESSYPSGSEFTSPTGDDVLINKNSVPTSEATEKENASGICQGEGPTEGEPNCQLLSDKSECAFSSTAAACIPPFALKNFSCSSECSDNPTELVIQVAGTGGKDNSCDLGLNKNITSGDTETAAGDGSYTSGTEYISQIAASILTNKNSVPSCEAIDKENDPANCHGAGLTIEKRGIYQKNHDTSESALFSTAAACRPPFATKNSCSNECSDNPSELVVDVAGNTGFALPSCDERENS